MSQWWKSTTMWDLNYKRLVEMPNWNVQTGQMLRKSTKQIECRLRAGSLVSKIEVEQKKIVVDDTKFVQNQTKNTMSVQVVQNAINTSVSKFYTMKTQSRLLGINRAVWNLHYISTRLQITNWVIWSDETKINIFGSDEHLTYGKTPHERVF